MMKYVMRYRAFCTLVLALLIGGGIGLGFLFPRGGESQPFIPGRTIFHIPPTSTAPCATGFTRMLPNYCRRTTINTVDDFLPSTEVCTARTTGMNLPAAATHVHLLIQWRALSINAVGLRLNSLTFWDSASCTGNEIGHTSYGVREEVAAIVGSTIGFSKEVDLFVRMPVTNTYYTTLTSPPGGGNSHIDLTEVLGYVD